MNVLEKLIEFEVILNWVKLKYRSESIKAQFEVATMIYEVFKTKSESSSSILRDLEQYLIIESNRSAIHWKSREAFADIILKLKSLKEMQCRT